MRKFLSLRSKRETNWKAVVDIKFRDPQIMLKALKILTSDRVKWADIYPPCSPSLPIVLLFLVFVQCTLEQI